MDDLALDSNDLPRLDGFDVREASGHEWQQVFQTARLRMENDNCDFAGGQVLLVFEPLIHGEENAEFALFRGGKKSPFFSPASPA